MDKEEAAKFLGISTRSLERYLAQGKISARYERSDKTRPKAIFEKEDLERFKEDLSIKTVRPAVIPEDSATLRQESDTSRQTLTNLPIVWGTDGEKAGEAVIEALARAIELVMERERRKGAFPPDKKTLLTLKEAQILTGLSRQRLKDAITTGKLKATNLGRVWRVKRSELDRYIETEF